MKPFLIILIVLLHSSFTIQNNYPSPSEVSNKIGEEVIFSGKVINTYYAHAKEGKPVFINIEKDFPNNPITVVVFQTYRMEFPMMDEIIGKEIAIRGTLQAPQKGKPIIILEKSEQLEILNP